MISLYEKGYEGYGYVNKLHYGVWLCKQITLRDMVIVARCLCCTLSTL